jgi:ABC-type uncharacterized transport system auxiliary subunit
VAKELLGGSGGRELQQLGLSFIRQSPNSVAIPILEELLSDKDESLRAASVLALAAKASPEQLMDIVGAYTEQPSYYYNVVTWLDRLLFAPGPLSSYYQAELHRKTKDLGG